MRRSSVPPLVGTFALALLALLASAGCRPDFAPYNRLTSLRVLTIQSDKPTPMSGETATLSALVFTPADDPANPAPTTVTYAWSWCPFPGTANDGHACLVTEADVARVAAQYGQTTQVPPFDLGAAPTAMLTNAIDPAVLAGLCAGVPGAPKAPDCSQGFPIQIALTVTSLDDQGNQTDRVDAVFTIHFLFDGGVTPANTNPVIKGVVANIAGAPVPIPDPATAANAPLGFPRFATTALSADVAMTEAETYMGLDDNGNPAQLTERLFLTWFVETGGTKYSRTSYLPNTTATFDNLLANTWNPDNVKNYPKGDARIYVVIHDSRGGIGWTEGIVHLESAP